MPEATPLVVAICDTHQAMCDMLSLTLEAEGWCPVVANLAALHDDADAICALLIQHQAHVVIFDIAPPYDQHWQVFLQVRACSPLPDAVYILTTTNKRHLEELVGRTPTIEVISKPFTLDRIVQAVRQATATTPAAQQVGGDVGQA